jgi:hypothetical protein
MQFGLGFYHPDRNVGESDVLIPAAEWFAQVFAPNRVRYQVMFAGTDRFSATRALNRKALAEIQEQSETGEISAFLLHAGSKAEPIAQLTLDAEAPEDALFRFGIFRAEVDPDFVTDMVRSAAELVQIVRAVHAFSIFGTSAINVLSELSGVPARHWQAPPDPVEDERFARIQYARPSLGKHVRGAAWGIFLGPELVHALGGWSRIEKEAPVQIVEQFPDGGAYLQMSREPLRLDDATYKAGAARLDEFLSDVMPPEPPFPLLPLTDVDRESGNSSHDEIGSSG